MEENKELYQQKAEARLGEIGAKIDELKAKSQQDRADLKIEMNKRIDKLQSDRKKVQDKLKQIKASGASAFSDLKDGTEMALTDLKTAIDSALDRFRN